MLFARLLTTANQTLSRTIILPRRFASRLFTEKHEWISVPDGGGGETIGRVGISNHAQEALGDVVYVQTPDVGSKYKQFDEVGAIESVKAASELLTPVSGEIYRVNEKLADKPGLVNSDCYKEGWLFEIKLDNTKELDNLMDEEKYNKFLEEGGSS
uniref:Glycine cleavage system H protein n=1 Tax=Aceria tosichella TaxID=561515 RepID=A0A6G1S3W0_9ACAR